MVHLGILVLAAWPLVWSSCGMGHVEGSACPAVFRQHPLPARMAAQGEAVGGQGGIRPLSLCIPWLDRSSRHLAGPNLLSPGR